jgi:tetratricopeptide (TPR) repeat protein
MSSTLAETMVKAASLQMTGNAREALAELHRAEAEGHHSAKLCSAVGHLQFELGQFQAAALAYEELLNLASGDLTAHYNLAVCLEKLGDWEKAAAAFRKATEIDPRRAGAQLGLGISLLHLQQPQESLYAFERCLERQPFREAAIRGKAVALQLLNRHREASVLYQTLLSRDPRSVELLANMIALSISQGDYELVVEACGRLLEIQPGFPAALECLAFAALARREYDAAVPMWRVFLESHPNSFAGWFNCGMALQKLGRYPEAAAAYSRAVGLNPESTHAQLNLGTVLHETEQWEPARTAYETALALDPTLKAARWNLALLCECRGELSRAEEAYSTLLERHPEARDAWFRLGYVRFQLGDFSGCIRAFDSCLAFQQKDLAVLLNLGIAHWRMRNLELAKETLQKVLTASPKSVEALRCLAAIALEQHDYEKALAMHVQLQELGEPSAELLYNTGLLLQKLGRFAEAARHYRLAIHQRPDFFQAFLNLGHALMALGKHEEAHSAWQTALKGNTELAEHFLM